MPTFKGKHTVENISGTRCSVVETDISESRMQFLTKLLEKNNYKVVSEKIADNQYKLGVTDMIFNAVIDVYERRLVTLEGKVLTHEYWFQMPEMEVKE